MEIMGKKSETQPQGLEAQLARLEEIVSSLEGEELELEAALRLFEEGVGRLRQAQEAIRSAELRIERVIESGGELQVEPLTPAEAR